VIVLYGVNLSTFTRKVRLALAEKGIEYRLEVAPMGSAKVRSMNPLGKIPVAQDGDVVIADSSVIIAYLERSRPERPLYPSDAASLARALWLEEYADTRLREATLPFFAERVVKPVFQGKPADTDVLARAAPGRDECFDYLERALAGHEFAVGDALTVADIAIGAQVVTYQQGEGKLMTSRWPELSRYIAALSARPCWMAILHEESRALAAARERRRPAV
jgi:glutathione S-transferase